MHIGNELNDEAILMISSQPGLELKDYSVNLLPVIVH